MKIAVYAGSFDPITNGHIDVLNRALTIFDKVIILVAINPNKTGRFSIADRLKMIKESIEELGLKNVEVDSYDGLTVDYAISHNAYILIRGLRSTVDFEYEYSLATANKQIDKRIESVFLMADKEKTFITSSKIVELAKEGKDVSDFVPNAVLKYIKK